MWITAERQSAGRGRRGRAWASERGNLYATLLLLDPAPLAALTNLPLVIALGVRNGLATLPGIETERLRIKWPNDILLDGAKLVGILLESESLSDGRQAVAIGCGVNVANAPTDTPYAVATLRAAGLSMPLDQVFEALADGVAQALDIWDRGRHFEAVRELWLRHASGLGAPARVNLPDGSAVTGRFEALDAQGRLLLTLDDGSIRPFSAGDLFLLPGAAQAAETDE